MMRVLGHGTLEVVVAALFEVCVCVCVCVATEWKRPSKSHRSWFVSKFKDLYLILSYRYPLLGNLVHEMVKFPISSMCNQYEVVCYQAFRGSIPGMSNSS